MTEKIKQLLIKYREIIMYIIFGGFTTVVNFAVYFVMPHDKAPIATFTLGSLELVISEWLIANIVAWIAAVIFAFIVNKIFVFRDKVKGLSALLLQIWQFVSVRILSFVLETLLMWVLIDIVSMDSGVAKIPVAVLTVVINYIASKLFIFKGQKNTEGEIK